VDVSTYTSRAPANTATPAGPSAGVRSRLDLVLRRLLTRGSRRSRLVQAGLDLTMIAVAVLTFAGVGAPEFQFHVIFVVLAMHAFLFGLRGTLWRIGIVSIVILAYVYDAGTGSAGLDPMDLTEWPLMFVIAVIVAVMADRREATAQLYARLFRTASDRLLAVQEDERRRFARDLHDGIGQTLTALSLALEEPGRGALTRDRIASARRLSSDAISETHELATRLRPARIDQLGLAGALSNLARHAGSPVHLEIEPDAARLDFLPSASVVEIYRITQEAVANAVRHAQTPGVDVHLWRVDGRLRVVIADTGRGFDPAEARDGGLGIAGMRERALLLDAALSIESAPGAGTRVTLDVPIGPAGH
jgi:signal transduction histidine kinase